MTMIVRLKTFGRSGLRPLDVPDQDPWAGRIKTLGRGGSRPLGRADQDPWTGRFKTLGRDGSRPLDASNQNSLYSRKTEWSKVERIVVCQS
jgi:hypothetical protein